MIDRNIRHVLIVLLGCFLLLFIQLNRIQVVDAESLRQHPANTRTVQRDFSRPRGIISTVDGVVVARSVESDGPFELLREYPEGELYGHVAGYLSFNIGADGVERSYNDELVGRTPALQLGGLAGILGTEDSTGQVVLTLRHDMQTAARDAMGDQRGSIVVLDPRSGDILAMWSNPSFDPNRLSSHDGQSVNESFTELVNADGNPLRGAAFRDIYFPGSTFKVVTATAAVESGVLRLDSPVFDVTTEYTPPLTTRPISNFGGNPCGGPLIDLLRQSCNTGFAEIGAELLGPERLIRQSQAFGFNTVPPLDIPGAVASRFPTDYGTEQRPPSVETPAGVFEDSPGLAQASIGQNDVSATPLQMALVAAAVANEGEIFAPRVVGEIKNSQGETVTTPNPQVWQRPMSTATAADMRLAMLAVVESGSGTRAQVSNVEVGGKTGTAQLGTDPPQSHAWFVAFAGRPGFESELVVAVFVEGNEGNVDQTGGRAAAPIAQVLIDQYFNG